MDKVNIHTDRDVIISTLFREAIIRALVVFSSILLLVIGTCYFYGIQRIVEPGLICFSFSLFYEIGTLIAWRWIVTRNTDLLTGFLAAISGFRFLFSLMLMGVYYATHIYSEMISFLCIFGIFYFAMMITQTVFYRRSLNYIN